jgi:hypothetical protein
MVKRSSMFSHLRSLFLEPNKLLVLNVNGVLCYFLPSILLQGNVRVFGKSVNKTKVEVRIEVENFLRRHFKSFITQFGLV